MVAQQDKKTQRIEVPKELAEWLTSYAFAFGRDTVDVAAEALNEYKTRKIGTKK